MRKNIQLSASLLMFCFLYQNIIPAIKFSGVDGSLNFDQSNSSLALSTAITDFRGILKIRTASGVGDNVVSSSGNIIFNGGVIQINNNQASFTGTYVPGSTSVADTITLGNGDYLDVFAGEVVQQAITVAASSTANITGSVLLSNSITLTNSTSTLNMGIHNNLSQNITMNGGKLVLMDNLYLTDGVHLVGNGTVDLATNTLSIGTSTSSWSGNLTFNRAEDLQINGQINLSGTWDFETASGKKESIINGNGNILDLTGGGIIQVGLDHTLHISDLHIKGLGGAYGSFSLASSATTPGTLVLSNVTIELKGNYTHSAGTIKVVGDKVRVISGGQYTFVISGTNTKIIVDQVPLIYETLGGTNTNPFSTASGGTLNTINGGVVRSAIADIQPADTTVDANFYNGQTVSLGGNRNLRSVSKIAVINTTGAKTVTLDAQDGVWTFPNGAISVITVDSNVTLTLKNVVLKNFTMDTVLLGSSSSILFGDGVVMEFGTAGETLTGNIIFNGNASIRGNGATMVVGDAVGSIQQTGSGKTLTLEDLNIELLGLSSSNGIRNTQYDSKIVMKNCDVAISGNNATTAYAFALGSLDIEGSTKFSGKIADAVDGKINFDFTSTGTLTIKSGATMELHKGVNFQYKAAYVKPFDTNTAASKRHLQFEDNSSTLFCDGCTLTSSATGLAFDKGNLVVNNQVSFVASNSVPESAEFGTSLNIEILAASLLDINGAVLYVPS